MSPFTYTRTHAHTLTHFTWTGKVKQFSQAFIHTTSDEQYVDCKSTKKKKKIALTGLTHEKEEKHLHLSSKYIHDNWYTFFHYYYFWRWDWLHVSVTNKVLHEVTGFSCSEELGVKTASGGNDWSRQIFPFMIVVFYLAQYVKAPGSCSAHTHTKSTPFLLVGFFSMCHQQNMIQLGWNGLYWSTEENCQVPAEYTYGDCDIQVNIAV